MPTSKVDNEVTVLEVQELKSITGSSAGDHILQQTMWHMVFAAEVGISLCLVDR